MHCVSTLACRLLLLHVPDRKSDSGKAFLLEPCCGTDVNFTLAQARHAHPVRFSARKDTHQDPFNGSVSSISNPNEGFGAEGSLHAHISQAGVYAWSVRSRLAARSSRARPYSVSLKWEKSI